MRYWKNEIIGKIRKSSIEKLIVKTLTVKKQTVKKSAVRQFSHINPQVVCGIFN